MLNVTSTKDAFELLFNPTWVEIDGKNVNEYKKKIDGKKVCRDDDEKNKIAEMKLI